MKFLRWLLESAGMISGDVWVAFVTVLSFLIINWIYGDSVAMLW